MTTAAEPHQLFPPLDAATEAALRASIERFGIVDPIKVDPNGHVVDGHHRFQIACETGIAYPVQVLFEGEAPPPDWSGRVREAHPHDITTTRQVKSLDPKQLPVDLNLVRRHLDVEQRRELVASLRSEGHSLRAIAGAVGVSKSQVAKDVDELSTSGQLKDPEKVTGLDGKERPSKSVRVVRSAEPSASNARDRTVVLEPRDMNAELHEARKVRGQWVAATEDAGRQVRSEAERVAESKSTEPGPNRTIEEIDHITAVRSGRYGKSLPHESARVAVSELGHVLAAADAFVTAALPRDRPALAGELRKARTRISQWIRILEDPERADGAS